MKPLALILCIVCQIFLVVGQLFLKRAMAPRDSATWRKTALRIIPGIACMTVWFFLWVGLLEKLELSHIFPFEGLNPALMVLGAWFFFKERLSARAWCGIALITIGILLVSGS